jgi:hypothetical protein
MNNQIPPPPTNGIAINHPDGTQEVLYVPTPKGLEYHARTEPNVLLYGGRGSGKSTIGRWDAHLRALTCPGFKYCILRRTYPELYKSHLTVLPGEMKKLGGEWNGTEKVAKYPNGSLGFFSHCQNDQDVLNLLSAEFYLMFFDEISTFEWDMFTKLAASVRAPIHLGLSAMVRAATNPLGISAEMINRYWILKDLEPHEDEFYNPNDWYAIKANIGDNPHLDAQEYRKRFSGLSAHVIKAWVDGDFSTENALFDFRPQVWSDGLGKLIPWHVVHDIDMPKLIKSATIYRAIDAGWFPDPTLCLWIAHLGNRHIVIHEKAWYKTPAVDIAADIKAIDKELGIDRVAMTYCDPSMDINTTADIRTVREIYEANGIPMENSINDRERFATAVHQSLAEQAGEGVPRLQIYVNGLKGAPYLSRTIPQMRYHPKQFKKMDDHKDDHAVVALAYYLMSHSADERTDLKFGGKLKKWMIPKDSNRFVLGRDNVRDKN